MKTKVLDILVPQYNETDNEIKILLDSIAIQQNIDFESIRVIITNDGSDVLLSDKLLSSYQFDIRYLKTEHKGVSAARNYCLDHSDAEYVMFCDADDMFYNSCGLYIIFREIEKEPFNTLTSVFLEETREPLTKKAVYITHEQDSTFVHGKVHRRAYLMENEIRWNDNLTIHEDSYFNCLCQRLSREVKYCPSPFYLWRWRDNSVCRHDNKYILKTYNQMLDSSTALVNEFLKRNRKDDAQFFIAHMIYDAYFTMNKKEWIDMANREYRDNTERRFAQYYKEFEELFTTIDEKTKYLIVSGIKNRMFSEGLLLESVTFDDWITHILSIVEEKRRK